jgi:NifU-like protein involved in Fe-S cluster formation
VPGVVRYPARVKCALLAWMAFKDALVRAQAATGEPTVTTYVDNTMVGGPA